jgi:hypothetical protein
MKRIIQILASIAVGSSILLFASDIAYTQRGYKAIGGEYIAAILAAIIIWWLIDRMEWR